MEKRFAQYIAEIKLHPARTAQTCICKLQCRICFFVRVVYLQSQRYQIDVLKTSLILKEDSLIMPARFFYLLAFVTFASCGIPDYWKDRTYTTNNGTQHTPIPFTIEARNTEYNEKDSPRDTFLRESLLNFTHIDLWDKTNVPPVNRSGTVS